jgi:hypothetical protein
MRVNATSVVTCIFFLIFITFQSTSSFIMGVLLMSTEAYIIMGRIAFLC